MNLESENVHVFQPESTRSVSGLVEHLFRHQTGVVTATLIRIFGIEHLDLVEDSVQEALVKALQHWPFHGVPQNPGGWILKAARNQVTDVLRRKTTFKSKEKEISYLSDLKSGSWPELEDSLIDPVLADDLLRLMFTCCHPVLTEAARVALTLKTLCGFSISEIARSFLTSETAIAQRVVRAKRKIRAEKVRFEMPDETEMKFRLESVLGVLYLLFNEGYNAHEGQDLIRHDLCDEAIRLTSLLVSSPSGNQPSAQALLALMLLQASRLPARLDTAGNLLLLVDRSRSPHTCSLL